MELKSLLSRIPLRSLLSRLPTLVGAALLGVGLWYGYGIAEERGWLTSVAPIKELAEELKRAPTPADSPAPRVRRADDRVATGGFCDARVELYVSGTREKQVAAMARDFLIRHGVSWSEVDIDVDEHGCDRFNYLNPGKTLPFAVINGRQIAGFHPETWRRALANEDG